MYIVILMASGCSIPEGLEAHGEQIDEVKVGEGREQLLQEHGKPTQNISHMPWLQFSSIWAAPQ
jgi:hypothetical protein